MIRVTIRDIATLAGVSPSTVSRALNDHPAISEKTRRVVQQACQSLQYVPDMTAKGLAGHMTNTIGVIVPDISNPYFSAQCAAISRSAAAEGYRVLLTNTLYDSLRETEAVDSMLSQHVDGMIISPSSPQSQEVLSTLLDKVPCIYLGNNHGSACSYVEADGERGAYEATQYLYHLGHRKIIFIGGRTNSNTLERRLNGYRRSMLLNGLAPLEILTSEAESTTEDRYYQCVLKLLKDNYQPDAFLAYSDIVAMQVLGAAKDCGLSVPENLSVIGFDNTSVARLAQINLTSVSLRKSRVGELAVKRLLEKINGDNNLSADILQPELIIGSTCHRIRPERTNIR